MPIFQKDLRFFLKITAVMAMGLILIIAALINIDPIRENYLVNYPSLVHWALSVYPIVTIIIGLTLIARISASERTYKTNIFLHALPVAPTRAFIARWSSLWITLTLYTAVLFTSMVMLSYRSVAIDSGALFQLSCYLITHITLITSVCLLFEKCGRFRMIAYIAAAVAYSGNLIPPLMKALGAHRSLISDKFSLLTSTSWDHQTIFSYLAIAAALTFISLTIQALSWSGIPRKLSFKEKYITIMTIMLGLVWAVSQITSPTTLSLPKEDFSPQHTLYQKQLSGGELPEALNIPLSIVNPGEYPLNKRTKAQLEKLIDTLTPELRRLISSYPSLLKSDGITLLLTKGPLSTVYHEETAIIAIPLDALGRLASAKSRASLRDRLLFDWLEQTCGSHLPLFAKSTNLDLIYGGLPGKEITSAQASKIATNTDQLRALYTHIEHSAAHDWLAWHDFGADLPSLVAAWTLESMEEQLGRESFLAWIHAHIIAKGSHHDDPTLAPLIGASVLSDEALQSVDFSIVKSSVLAQLKTTIANHQRRENSTAK